MRQFSKTESAITEQRTFLRRSGLSHQWQRRFVIGINNFGRPCQMQKEEHFCSKITSVTKKILSNYCELGCTCWYHIVLVSVSSSSWNPTQICIQWQGQMWSWCPSKPNSKRFVKTRAKKPGLTFVAFFTYFALSFSISCQERMGVFRSSPTTIPGPCVAGPPMNIIILAPVLGKVHCFKINTNHDRY